MRVVVAIEPLSYRQAIGQAIQGLRPHMEVMVTDSDALGPEALCLDSDLVICSQPNSFATNGTSAWVEYRSYDEPVAQFSLNGKRSELDVGGLDDLLSIVDEVDRIAATNGSLCN